MAESMKSAMSVLARLASDRGCIVVWLHCCIAGLWPGLGLGPGKTRSVPTVRVCDSESAAT
eukprot:3508783-Alexandrium_andersonii.AAC.1